jgi:hypothetical protein
MSSRKRIKRQKRAQEAQAMRQAIHAHNKGELPASDAENCPAVKAERPNAMRKSRGMWAIPKGMGKHEQPAVDMASDMIGVLYVGRQISSQQEQAARLYQELRAAYLAELPDVRGYKSCLAGSVPGYDDGDGNPEVIAAFRSLEKRLTMPQRREMLIVCDMDERPRNIETLRAALDAISA